MQGSSVTGGDAVCYKGFEQQHLIKLHDGVNENLQACRRQGMTAACGLTW